MIYRILTTAFWYSDNIGRTTRYTYIKIKYYYKVNINFIMLLYKKIPFTATRVSSMGNFLTPNIK